jgi:hypothetical protein
MKCRIAYAAFCALAALTLLFPAYGCGGSEESEQDAGVGEQGAAVQTAKSGAGSIQGEVQETMDSGGYTYVRVRSGDRDIWAAGPVTKLAVGDEVSLSTGMQMNDFRSETLDRTFETIYFVSSFGSGSAGSPGGPNMAEALKQMHGGKDVLAGEVPVSGGGAPVSGAKTVLDREVVASIDRVEGGVTVAEIYAGKAELAGRVVKIRGIVVKFTPSIMSTNWLHLQDGTCEGESCDLTVTTNATVAVGDLVTLQGVLSMDKDFGAGYRYEVIVQGATLITD